MAGILDKNTRVVDMVLTLEGKRLLANGGLQFVYFALFDDEVDYDPIIYQSGSLTSEQLSGTVADQVENTLVREATTGYRLGMNASGSDFTNVRYPLFTVKQGSQYLPRMQELDAPSGSATLEVKQQKHQEIYTKVDQNGNVVQQQGPFDRGYDRYDSQDLKFHLQLWPTDVAPDKQHQEGVLIRVFRTGSEGIVEVDDRRDSSNDLTYNNDLIFHMDSSGRKRKKKRGG